MGSVELVIMLVSFNSAPIFLAATIFVSIRTGRIPLVRTWRISWDATPIPFVGYVIGMTITFIIAAVIAINVDRLPFASH